MTLTAKQFEALDFMLKGDPDGEVSAQRLMRLYEQRWMADPHRLGYAGTNKRHGWRRSAGTVLERMRQAGLLQVTHVEYGSFTYKLTDAGRGAYVAARDLDGRPLPGT